ncbi:MAG: hypothetical protein WAV90_05720, partial [Gordonia amarae]
LELVPEPMRVFAPVIAIGAFHGGRRDTREWMRPVGAVIACATVTQVASRFAFRGVTVGPRMLPMHAAVVGMDSVIAVDEPHLSVPAIVAMRHGIQVQRDGALVKTGDGSDRPVPEFTVPVSQVVMLGATPPSGVLVQTRVGVDDDGDDRSHPIAGRRIAAAKSLRLRLVTQPSTKPATFAQVAAAMAEEAIDANGRDLARGETPEGGTDGVLVFCNSISTARKVHARLVKAKATAILVHGKMRGYDRPRAQDVTRGVITVSTQALEVGADFDCFAVITQPCPLPALIQRAGRCNRRGDMNAAEVVLVSGDTPDAATMSIYGKPVIGVVLADPDDDDDAEGDADGSDESGGGQTPDVDGAAVKKPRKKKPTEVSQLLRAVKALCADGPVPFGPGDIRAFTASAVDAVGTMEAPEARTATLHRQAADYLARTSPNAEFDVSVLLNGPDAKRDLDVTLSWRRDSDLDLIGDVPVMDPETVTVPITALRTLLRRASGDKIGPAADPAVSDVDDGSARVDIKHQVSNEVLSRVRVLTEVNAGDQKRTGRRKAKRKRTWAPPKSLYGIKPGSIVVLGSSLGGYAYTGFDALIDLETPDISAEVAVSGGFGRFVAHGALRDALLESADNDDDSIAALDETARNHCRELSGCILDGDVPVTVLTLEPNAGSDRWRFIVKVGYGPGSFADGGQSHCASLGEHGHQVGSWTAAAAAVLPMPEQVRSLLAEAGFRHDDGKEDPRFQQYLGFSGDPDQPATAKSRRTRTNAEEARMRRDAQLPQGWRHEVASCHGIDNELVRHLVLSHHGRGRPLISHADTTAEETGDSRISSHAETFDRLGDRFGPWGLALLETVLRWCDHQASAHPWTAEQAVSAGAVARFPRRAPCRTPKELSDPSPEHVVRLPGLSASPMGGTLAAVGLLEAVYAAGHTALLRWNPNDQCVEFGSDLDLGPVIRGMRRDPSAWLRIDAELLDRSGAKLEVGKGKVEYPHLAIDGLADTDPMLRLLPDTTTREAGGQQLVTLGAHNNGTAFTAHSRVTGTEAFFSTTAGVAQVTVDGSKGNGIDTGAYDYPQVRNRPDILAWALDGFLALGWAPETATVRGKVCTLPQPTRWTTLSGYRALALQCSDDGPNGTWRRSGVRSSSKYMVVWASAGSSQSE